MRTPTCLVAGAGLVLMLEGCVEPATHLDRCAAGGDRIAVQSESRIPGSLELIFDLTEPAAGQVPSLGPNELWVAQRSGQVLAIETKGGTSAGLLDLSERLSTEGEGGLVGLAITDDGNNLYLSFTDLEQNLQVVGYAVVEGIVDMLSERTLLTVPLPSAFHTGGTLRISANGLLYISVGDGAQPDQLRQQLAAQSTSDLAGSILRVDPRGGDPYSIPDDNPLVGLPDSRGEIFLWGLRNPWGFSFDPETAEIWIGDVGEGCWEEINIAPAGGGVNFGWPAFEGTMPTGRTSEPTDHILPITEYRHSPPGSAIVGGFVYTGESFPELQGAYLFADYGQASISWLRRQADGSVISGRLDVNAPYVTALVENLDGEVIVLTQRAGIFLLSPP